MSPPRRRKNVNEWPAADRAGWQAATRSGALFDDGGDAARWAPVTRANAEKAYGMYLAFLQERGLLDPQEPPEERITPERIAAYVQEVKESLKPSSLANRLRDLLEAARVIWPGRTHEPLRVIVRRLQYAARRQERIGPNIASTSDIYLAGIGRMERVRSTVYEKRDVQAVQFGDGLMMALLACKPIRLRNLQAMTIGVHLLRKGGIYVIAFEPHETKTGQPIRAELPPELTPWIEEWFSRFRPILLKSATSDAMWISAYRQRMAASTITARFTEATRGELGVAISPHHVRHALATGIAVSLPDKVRMTPFLLDHKGEATSRKHYNLATALAASDTYLGILKARRQRAGGT